MRVALYARVSTEEQKQHGYSIDAQLESLRSWAKDHEIVGEYVDAGISGKRPYQKRPELSRFMRDLENGLAVDALVFCKLDRFYRSVKLYYQAMEVLDRHKVAWVAIQEDYETVTASGRFKVNIMLSVAENEADRTAERIKTVFEHKVTLGESITHSLPLGLKNENKHVVPNEYAPAVVAAFEEYARVGNKTAVRDLLSDVYGLHISITSVSKLLQNRLYVGEYRDNPNYCEPIVPRELFDRVQKDLASRSTKRTPSGAVYLFSGLIICGECGRRMGAVRNAIGTVYYRCCVGHAMYKDCQNNKCIRESVLEADLLKETAAIVAGQSVDYEPEQKPKVNKKAVQQKLERLKDLYVDGDISKEKYRQLRDELTAKLQEPEQPKKMTVYGDNFLKDYASLDRQGQKNIWHGSINKIVVDAKGDVTAYFM